MVRVSAGSAMFSASAAATNFPRLGARDEFHHIVAPVEHVAAPVSPVWCGRPHVPPRSQGHSESHGEAADAAERLPGRCDARLGGPARIEPGALHAEDGTVAGVARTGRDGGTHRREPAHSRDVAVAEFGMAAQFREPAARHAAGVKIGLGMSARDRPALPPEPARGFGLLVRALRTRCLHSRRGDEGAGLDERRAPRRCPGATTDETEKIAVIAVGGIRPTGRHARAVGPDEEQPAAVAVARDPVTPSAAAMGKAAPAGRFGLQAEHRCNGGPVHRVAPAGPLTRDGPRDMGAIFQFVRGARYRPPPAPAGARAPRPQANRGREAPTVLRIGSKQKGTGPCAPALTRRTSPVIALTF